MGGSLCDRSLPTTLHLLNCCSLIKSWTTEQGINMGAFRGFFLVWVPLSITDWRVLTRVRSYMLSINPCLFPCWWQLIWHTSFPASLDLNAGFTLSVMSLTFILTNNASDAIKVLMYWAYYLNLSTSSPVSILDWVHWLSWATKIF